MNFCFRTESAADDRRVPALLAAIGVDECEVDTIAEPGMPGFTMGVFRFASEEPLDVLRERIAALVRKDDRFVDMHRCFQTLAAGDRPNEHWYMH